MIKENDHGRAQVGLGPAWYRTRWSDYIIHKIHTRVLLHIERLAVASETQKEVGS